MITFRRIHAALRHGPVDKLWIDRGATPESESGTKTKMPDSCRVAGTWVNIFPFPDPNWCYKRRAVLGGTRLRIDSRNLLARLDQPDFDYRDFPTSEGGEDAAYRWPLIEFVHRATVVPRRPAAVAQPAWGDYPQQAAAPQPAYAPPPRAADPSGSRAFFAHYRPSVAPQPAAPEPPAPPPPAAQDLGSLFASYSDGR